MLLCILIGLFYIVLRHRGDAYQHENEKGKKQREKGGPQGTGRQRETEAGKGTKREKENLYYAELRASCFCPYFLVFLIRQATERKRIYDRIDVPIGTV